MYDLADINDKLSYFNERLLQIVNNHAPMRQVRFNGQHSAPWFTDTIRLMIAIRDKALKNIEELIMTHMVAIIDH